MSYGVQVFNENGNVNIDMSSRITKILGEFTIPTSNGSFVDSDISSLSEPFVVIFCDENTSVYPTIELSGNTISWEWLNYPQWGSSQSAPSGTRKQMTCIYGGY